MSQIEYRKRRPQQTGSVHPGFRPLHHAAAPAAAPVVTTAWPVTMPETPLPTEPEVHVLIPVSAVIEPSQDPAQEPPLPEEPAVIVQSVSPAAVATETAVVPQ